MVFYLPGSSFSVLGLFREAPGPESVASFADRDGIHFFTVSHELQCDALRPYSVPVTFVIPGLDTCDLHSLRSMGIDDIVPVYAVRIGAGTVLTGDDFIRHLFHGILDILSVFVLPGIFREEILPAARLGYLNCRSLFTVCHESDCYALRTYAVPVVHILPDLPAGDVHRLGNIFIPGVGYIQFIRSHDIVFLISKTLRILFRHYVGGIFRFFLKIQFPRPHVFSLEVGFMELYGRSFDLLISVLDVYLESIGALILSVAHPCFASA